MANSSSNNLPFVPENTIDPAAGLNLALADIDILLQLQCKGFASSAPISNTDGDRWIVDAGATGAFLGQEKKVAQYISEGALWRFMDANMAVIGTKIWIKVAGDWAEFGAGSLDGMPNLYVLDWELDTPPVSPTSGDSYIVASGGTGDWTGHDDDVAAWNGAAWVFSTPENGWRATVAKQGGYQVQFYAGDWELSQGVLAEVFIYNFTSDADATASNMRAATPIIAITDTGSNLTTTRTLTLPDVLLAPKFSVVNATTQSITIKGNGDAGPGVTIKPDGEEKWLINYGKLISLPMYLASLSAGEFMGGLDSLNNTEKASARTRLDVYSKAESDLSKAKINGINSQTGTAYTLLLSDAGKFIETTNGAANTLTFPKDVFAVGHQMSGAQGGAGQTTLVADTGVTLKSKNGLKLTGQDAVWTAVCVASNVFRIGGDLEA